MATYLVFNNAEAIQYADLLKGDLRMNVVIPNSPSTSDVRRWGFYSLSKQSGAYFEITGTMFQAKVYDGANGTSNTVAITWDADWEGEDIIYRIKWSAGRAVFYMDGVQKADIALEDEGVVLANSPLSVYVQNATADNMLVGNIDVVNVQTYL